MSSCATSQESVTLWDTDGGAGGSGLLRWVWDRQAGWGFCSAIQAGARNKVIGVLPGPSNRAFGFEVEAVGALLALHLLKLEGHASGATIRMDNQAVIVALEIHKPKPAQSIIDEILLQAEDL